MFLPGNIQPISYIITHRSSCHYRVQNLYSVTQHLLKNIPNIEIIVVEQDAQPSSITLPPQVKHYFVYNSGLFNRSWGFNVGFTNATNAVLVFGDNDIILPPKAIFESTVLCPQYQTISPYPTGSIIDLSLNKTSFFITTQSINYEHYKDQSTRIGPYAGGVIFMTRDAFIKLGGWEEQIRGWGGEDDHMTIKINRRLKHTFEINNSFALHLYHRPNNLFNDPSLKTENPCYQNNLQQIANIKNMTEIELEEYCKNIFPNIGKPLK